MLSMHRIKDGLRVWTQKLFTVLLPGMNFGRMTRRPRFAPLETSAYSSDLIKLPMNMFDSRKPFLKSC